MKIVFDGLIYYLQKQGGISRYFDELINGLANREDCEVTILLRRDSLKDRFSEKVKIEIINSNINFDSKIKKYFSVYKDGLAVNKYLKSRDYSGAIFHYTYYSFYKNLRAKSVLTVHDLVHEKFPHFFGGLINKLYLWNKRKTIKKADRLIAISEQTKNDLVNIYSIKESKINVVHHGIGKNFKVLSVDEKNNFQKKQQIIKPYYLFVGNRDLYKNFNFLLKTYYSWLEKENYDLYCIGGGSFNNYEIKLINDLGLEDKVKLFINVSEEDLVKFYNCSMALVYPTLYEGFGLPILEAMACGINVLASDINIFHEIGKDALIYFSPEDSNSLISALNICLVPEVNKINLGFNIIKEYNWENTVFKTLQVYKQ